MNKLSDIAQKTITFFENPQNMRKMKIGSFVFIGVVIIIGFFIPREAHFSVEEIPAFYSVLGLVACFGIVIFSKTLGKIWLEKKEDYYDK